MPASTELPIEVHEPLEQFLAEHLDLPILPEAAARIIALCQDPDADAHDIHAALERDPSLASHVLRIANSALFAPVEPIVSLRQAVSRLGMTTIRNLALAVSMQGRIFCGRKHEDLTRRMWTHSAVAAVFAREVARRLKRNADVAFLCGLMHDVGRPLVLQAAVERPEILATEDAAGQLLEAAMDAFHARVGARLVQAWGLPYPIAAVIAAHHEPESAQEHVRDAQIVQLADVMSHWALEEALEADDFPADDALIGALGLTPDEVASLLGTRQQALSFASSIS